MTDLLKALVSAGRQVGEAQDALEYHYPQLESVLSTEVMESLETVSDRLDCIYREVVRAVGGIDAYYQLREEFEE